MSRGLSKVQTVIVERIKEKGCMDFFAIEGVVYRVREEPKMDAKEKAFFLPLHDGFRTEILDIKNASSIYRMMKSLEKRGLVAMILKRRPRVWAYVEWQGNKPTIPRSAVQAKDFRERVIRYRTKGVIWSWTLTK